jgi:hypothetical protein
VHPSPEHAWSEICARPDARELAEREGLAGVQGALAELIEKATAAAGT